MLAVLLVFAVSPVFPQDFGSLPANRPLFLPPGPSLFLSLPERAPIPLIRPDKPAPVIRQGPEPGQAPLARLDLASLHNRLWRTSLTARIAGHVLHVSAQESRQGHYFLVLHDPQGQTFFFRDLSLAFSGKEILVNNAPVRVSLAINIADLWGSRLVISDRGTGRRWAFAMREIARAMYEAGEPLSLEGRSFRAHYTDQIFEDASGGVARLGEPLLVLMVKQRRYFNEQERYLGDAVETDPIPSSVSGRVLVGFFTIHPYGSSAYAFRKADHGRRLEIFPAP